MRCLARQARTLGAAATGPRRRCLASYASLLDARRTPSAAAAAEDTAPVPQSFSAAAAVVGGRRPVLPASTAVLDASLAVANALEDDGT